jgi:prepilin-type processing-associated H-X9-DG protein
VAAPYGFAIQGAYADNPADELWQGFFCPSQNKRNTMSEQSPELNFADQQEGAPTRFKHGSGYMVNKLLRSPATNGRGTNLRYPSQVGSASSPAANPGALYDNVYSTPRVTVTATGTSSPQEYHIQAINSDEILNSADTAYMCDTQDYRIGNDTTDAKYDTYPPGLPAGRWMSMNDHSTTARKAVVLGARHNAKANVLYADSHVTRDNLVPRNRRGDLITATTFADWTSDRDLGNVHHLMPTGRRF